ncbi:TonB-dependent receptor [Asticcacaulis sp. AC466]|uniref:TonB-dependent receptor n=1 Tax=Asticcacaulis sp. AC466 TaxID=1282362 RepID=UPI000400D456|nr:TonB-dependent receptor [Asticcacaulis sp. AC466]
MRQPNRSRWRAGIAAVIVLLFLAVPVHGQAQALHFDVPRQPLGDALNAIAEQSHTQLLFSPDAVRGRVSEGVRGQLTAEAAFKKGLAHSGLCVRRVSAHTFVIYAEPTAALPIADRVKPIAEGKPVEVVVTARRQLLSVDGGGTVIHYGKAGAPVAEIGRDVLLSKQGGNALDSLSLFSGVHILNTGSSFIGGVDGASRGEGMYVAARGLNAEYSLNLSDGVPIAQGMPYSRAMQMGVLPPEGLQAVSLYRANTADMAGDAIGVTLDWRTPNPFDFPANGYTRLQVLSTTESRARDYGLTGLGGGVTFELARRWGRQKDIAVYLSLYSDRRLFANSEIGGIMAAQNDHAWAFGLATSATGTEPAHDADTNLALTGLNFGVSEGTTRRTGGVFNIDWRPVDGLDAYLRLNMIKAHTEQASTLDQIVPTAVSWRKTDADTYRLSVDSVSTRVWYETNPETIKLANVKTGVDLKTEAFSLSAYLFASHSGFDRPDHLETSIRVDENDGVNAGNAPRPLGGDLIRYSQSGRPLLNLTPDMLADFDQADTRLLARRAGQLTAQTSEQTRAGGGFDAHWRPAGGLMLDWGARVTDSWRSMTYRDWRNDYFSALMGRAGVTWSDLGLVKGTYSQAVPGLYDWRLPRVDNQHLEALFDHYKTDASFDTCGALFINNDNCANQSGSEQSLAAYAALHIPLGKWTLSPGWRQELTTIRNTYWFLPMDTGNEQPGEWQNSETSYNEGLPSLFATWRGDDGMALSLGVWRAYSRPSFQQLAGGAKATATGGVITIESGNPKLKPVTATNADISLVWPLAHSGQIRLAAFGKGLKDYLYDAGTGFVNASSSDADAIRYVIPHNGGRGSVVGLELEGQVFLYRHFSLSTALTRQWTDVDTGSAAVGRHKPLQNAPGFIANLGLGYAGQTLSATLNYRFSSAYLASYDVLYIQSSWDDQWVRPSQRLDVNGSWSLTPHARVRFGVDNLLNEVSYWTHVGKHSLAVSDIVDSGQTYRLSFDYSF